MNNPLRTLAFAVLAASGLAASAQGNTIYVIGSVSPCNPAMLNSPVTITAQGYSGQPVTYVTTLNVNCSYSVEMLVPDSAGYVTVSASCGNGTMTSDSSSYVLTPPFTVDVIVNLACSGAPSCQACFTVAQAAPFTAVFNSCSIGSGPFTYLWDFSGPGGGAVPGDNITHVFSGPGTYAACLNVTDADGNSCNTCQSVVVDADGNINPTPTQCNADFWIVQAYTTDPISGDPTPVPNELWAWNLSNNLDTATFHWDFGDGESSDEAFPTHVYPSSGPFELCLTVASGGCTDTFCDTVSVDGDGIIRDGGGFTLSVLQQAPTGITEHSALSEITTYPNPVTDELNISLNSMLKGSLTIELMDINGRMVSSAAHVLSTGKNLFSTAVNTLAPGLYTVRVSNGSQQLSQRFVKIR